MDSQKLGAQGEHLAAELLRYKGYHILVTNLHSRFSEGDIICEKEGTIVLVEVKTRSKPLSDPIQTITKAKIRRLQRVLHQLEGQYPNRDIRLDVITVYWKPDSEPQLFHYEALL